MDAVAAPARPLATALIAAMALTAAVAAAVLLSGPPAPAPASAPEEAFSAERAAVHLEAVAAEPRPPGSDGHAAARDLIAGELEKAGLETEVQSAVGTTSSPGSVNAAATENVIGVLPGTDPTGRVVVAAHYDTVPGSPGAGDDGAGVAAMLEAARAMAAGEAPRNDVVFLFTDAEEPGLLGAEAFTSQHPLGRDGGVVLNWEGRGSSGPSSVFRTAPLNDSGVIGVLAEEAPHPRGDSASAASFADQPYDTDMTVFTDAGFAGLDSAFGGDAAHYHSAQDTVENLSRATLQHHGDNMLGMARALGGRDLGSLESGEPATFFNAAGRMAAYPSSLDLPIGAAALALSLVAAVVARMRRAATVPRMLGGLVAAAAAAALAYGAALALWQGVLLLRPDLAPLAVVGDLYRPAWLRAASVAVTVGVLAGWYLAARRLLGPTATAVGGTVAVALLGALSAFEPGVSHTYTIPALLTGAGLTAALVLPERMWIARTAAVALGSLGAVLLLVAPAVSALTETGIPGAPVLALLWAPGAVLLAPVLEIVLPRARRNPDTGDGTPEEAPVPRPLRRPVWIAVALVSAGAVVAAGTVLRPGYTDAEHPLPVDLAYVLDADTGEAVWAARGSHEHPWAAPYVEGDVPFDASELLVSVPPRFPVAQGPATGADLAAPTAEARPAPPDDVAGREAVLRVGSARGATDLRVDLNRVPEELEIAYPGVDGRTPGVEERKAEIQRSDEEDAAFRIGLSAVPEDGVELRMRFASEEEVEVRVTDRTRGLEGLPDYTEPPGDVGPWVMPDSHSTLVTRTVRI
ncbi:M20/M25/M40 family metallo-hydrolase [Nocardiopsis sp. RSe5-2]|uniref:M20/M25/M40 family metallo-hydrolase n=1 Tax=Nocardiopsis endophytica TaxID=3018445 RepID=A0ABT4U710_9ACTN|nr:M20/M25/M40 family metallo-hydrolase [Nocardiopsis endophytica]MDA2812728.1 M20/M25/M40 family metallo-hydrolase [Nocardiopsis endophytica]